MATETFSDLALAAYCPRKLYYRRREDARDVPSFVDERRAIAFRYAEMLAADRADESLLAVPYETWCRNLRRASELDVWPAVLRPDERDVYVEGRRCRGIVHKVLDVDGPLPDVVSAGTAPADGAWETDVVRAVAAAKALASDRGHRPDRAVVEYPASGVIRPIRIDTRRKARFRRTLRTVRSLDGPPPRAHNRSKCESCEYRDRCGR